MFNDPRFLAVLFLFCTSRDFRNLAVLIRSKTADFYHPPMKLGKVMFSVVSICPQGGGSPCNHHALDLTDKASPTHPPILWHGTSLVRNPRDMGIHWTSPDRDLFLASDIWQPSLETCSNLSISRTVPQPVLTSGGHQSTYGRRKRVVCILLECFLVINCCLSVHGGCLVPGGDWSWGCLVRGGGVCLVGGVPGPGGGVCLVGGCLVGGAWSGGCLVETPPSGYCCGRYTSYWNAFLFFLVLTDSIISGVGQSIRNLHTEVFVVSINIIS